MMGTGFHSQAKLFELHFPLNGQTRQTELPTQASCQFAHVRILSSVYL